MPRPCRRPNSLSSTASAAVPRRTWANSWTCWSRRCRRRREQNVITRGRRLPERHSTVDAFAHNEIILRLNILAYEVAHAGRCLMEAATRKGWSLRRFRERVLRAAARVIVSGRRVTMIIGEAFANFWQQLWPQLEHLRYADP